MDWARLSRLSYWHGWHFGKLSLVVKVITLKLYSFSVTFLSTSLTFFVLLDEFR